MPISQRSDFLPADRKLLPRTLSGTTGITSLTFASAAKKRDMLLESNFRVQEENFAANNNGGHYTQLFNLGPGTVQNTSGKFQYIGGTAVGYRMNIPINCPFITVSVDIEPGLGVQATNSNIGVGVMDTTGTTDKYWVEYNEINNSIKIRKIINSVVTDVVSATCDGRPTRIHFVACGKFISMWTTGSNGNPNPKCWGACNSVADFDLRVTASMATRYPYLVMQPDSGGIVRINRWTHSIFGGLGAANHTIVRYMDGTPITIGNKFYVCTTVPGVGSNPGSNEWTHFHSAIFSVDRHTFEMHETAKLFQIEGTKIYGQHVYCPRFDPITNTWTVIHQTFGSSDDTDNVRVKYNTYKGDLLHGVHILPAATTIGLTKIGGAANDKLIYDFDFVRINGLYYCAYATGDGAGVSSSTAWHTCTASGASLGALQQQTVESNFFAEGPKISKIGGTWIFTAKAWTAYAPGGISDNSYVAWNLQTGTRLGTFSADLAESGSTKTHTAIFEDSLPNNTTRYVMCCFMEDTALKTADDVAQLTWTQGSTLFQVSTATNAGHEHPSYEYPYREPSTQVRSHRDSIQVTPIPDSRRYSTTATGTAYTLTASSAAVDFGTTDPVITLAEPGKYEIEADVVLLYNGATFAANRTVTVKLRRTNNTAADLTNATIALTTDIITTKTETFANVHLRADDYTNAGANDAITIYADVSVLPSAGSIQVSFAKIYARKIA